MAKTKEKDIKTNKKRRQIRKTLQGLMSGSILTEDVVRKQFPFLLLLAVLALIYIANRYHAERVFIETESLKKEISELRSEKVATQSVLMRKSRRSEVMRLLRENGSELTESSTPPVKVFCKEAKP
ncbi:MAG TPA: FtsL-like putative cell division protein [Bacteroidales bacterium]|nr:FtsL-like putative cell division protein [Bacteroidales bacterium]